MINFVKKINREIFPKIKYQQIYLNVKNMHNLKYICIKMLDTLSLLTIYNFLNSVINTLGCVTTLKLI